jgi:hypothetical protein
MNSRLQKDLLLRVNLALAFLCSLITLWYMTREASEAETAIVGGFSLPRLTIILVVILFVLFVIWLFIKSLSQNFWAGQSGNFISNVFSSKSMPLFLLLLLVVFYFLLFSSSQLLGNFSSYRERLSPLLAWLAILVLQAFITLLIARWFETSSLKLFQDQFKGVLVAFVLLGILVLFITLSRVGLTPDKVYWMEPGVPLLIQQVLAALGVATLFVIIQKQGDFISKYLPSSLGKLLGSKLLLCLLIWGAASVLWLSQPLRPAYNSLPPSPPNFQRYPFGDAMYYDIHAQSLLIGKPIPSHFWAKPLYTLFLSLLHVLAGQDYALIIALQAVVLAIIPVLGYLIMDAMGSQTAGLLIASLMILRERNAIALSNVIQVTNSKLLMSDVFSMGLMALLTLLLVRWSKNPVAYRNLPFAAGGVLGLLVLTRGNPIILFPFLVLIVIFVIFSQKRLHLWREVLLICILGFMLPLAPWFIRNYQLTGKLTFQDAPEAYAGQLANLYAPDPSTDYGDQLSSELNAGQDTRSQNQMLRYILQHPGDIIQFVSAHYFHNLIFSYIYLPQSFQIESLRSYVKTMPFWVTWEGYLPGGARVILILNLGILALGFSTLWKRNKAFVLAPVLLALGYNLSVSIVRLSGWRFILPFDWLMLVFYSMGLVQIGISLFSIFNRGRFQDVESGISEVSKNAFQWWKPVLMGLAFVGIGLGVTLGNALFQSRSTDLTNQQSSRDYEEVLSQAQVGLDSQDLRNFVEDDEAMTISGRALFPTFLTEGGGFQSVFAPAFDEQSFSRLAFYVTGSQGIGGSIQLDSPPETFPGFSEVIVLGCHTQGRYGDYVDVLAVILKSEPATVYVRSSLPERLTCPLPPP